MYFKSLLALLGVLLFSTQGAFALGLSPSITEAKDLAPGMTLERHVFFTRGNADKAEKVKVEIIGDAAEYIHPVDGYEMILPKGSQQVSFDFTIEPETLATGTYEAIIRVMQMGEARDANNGSTGSAVLAGAQGTIRFSITNKAIEAFSIKQVEIGHTEEKRPLGFSFLMKNEGNVDTRLNLIKLHITDQADPSFKKTITIPSEDLPITSAFDTQQITLLTELELPIGLYYVDVEGFDKDKKSVFKIEQTHVQVFPEGSLAQKGSFAAFSADKELYELGELAQFEGVFKNTGSIGVEASMAVEILRDGQRIDVLKTDPLYVPEGDTLNPLLDFRITESGPHIAQATVHFGIHNTESISAEFDVPSVDIVGFVIIFVGLLIVGSGVFLIIRKKRQMQLATAPVPPNTGVAQ